jgi:hypothetical protein
MGFLLRALFVVGVIYVLSPLRADLPDWLTAPAPDAASEVTPVLADVATRAIAETCKADPAACASVAGQTVGALLPKDDAQAAFEALVNDIAAMPNPTLPPEPAPAETGMAKAAPADPKPPSATPAAPLGLTTIPLPPRRKI